MSEQQAVGRIEFEEKASYFRPPLSAQGIRQIVREELAAYFKDHPIGPTIKVDNVEQFLSELESLA